jgi:methionine--tRNA ligase beta chain
MIPIRQFAEIELVVGRICEVADHPNADRLYVMKVDLGGEVRQIVAGIRKSYPADALVGRNIVVIKNLEPAVIRGVESQGMLLAASTPEGNVVLLTTEKDMPAGCKIK